MTTEERLEKVERELTALRGRGQAMTGSGDGDRGGGQSPPLNAIRKTPGWAIAVGGISIVYASSSILYDLIYSNPGLITMFRVGVTGLLLLAGVSLLCRSPYTALLHRLWACIILLAGFVVLGMGMMLGWFSLEGFSSTEDALPALAGIALLVFLVFGYPVFLLVWFSRRKVRRQVLAWRHARAKRT